MKVNISLDLSDAELRQITGTMKKATRVEVKEFVAKVLRQKLDALPIPVGRGRFHESDVVVVEPPSEDD